MEIKKFKEAETYKQFKDLSFYSSDSNEYNLFPFNFNRLNEEIVLTNDTGEFVICSDYELRNLVKKELSIENNKDLFLELLNKQFIYMTRDREAINRKAVKYRTKKQFLYTGAVLLVFVVTTRCQHKCHYCQITPQSTKAIEFDMTEEIAEKSVIIAMQSPAKSITIEFQGGETLLAFNIVKFIVQYAKQLNETIGKNIEFVLATSLVDITREQLEFIKEHNILLSTSLDGPEDLHNTNRPIHSENTYKKFIEGFNLSKEYVGDTISPLLTISKNSLSRIEDIIKEYQKIGKNSISLRALSPYGFAVKTMSKIGYSEQEYIKFYLNALDYIIDMNLDGTYFREEYATLLLRRILTPYSTGYVDLQSPSGAGVNALVFHYNGEIYPADEARMLAEMGDKNFLLGNVSDNTYKDIINKPKLQLIIQDSCAESLTNCSECAYLPYCGCDPLFNYVTQKDHYGHRPTSDFCYKQMSIYNYLFSYIKNKDKKVLDIFWAWINHDIDFVQGKC
ncbi:MAG: His-Xaa-Ser system radical SAM maturase HxsB [Candidatus Gracilibacteria bacterium]